MYSRGVIQKAHRLLELVPAVVDLVAGGAAQAVSEKSAIVKLATTVPKARARLIVAAENVPCVERYPIIPPAKLSPAPVGSTTFSVGNAGRTNSPRSRAEQAAVLALS